MKTEEKWRAVLSRDEAYDGLFFYGVKTTGIFCRPVCRAKTPKQENVSYFPTPEAASSAGFRPCRKCRPDLARYEPERDLLGRAKALYEAFCLDPARLDEELGSAGVSRDRLARLFRKHEDCTPVRFLARCRVGRAREALEQTDAAVVVIAFGAGFESLSNFYKRFREETGKTPSRYRAEKRTGK